MPENIIDDKLNYLMNVSFIVSVISLFLESPCQGD